jgi:hypothetical protein
MFFALAQADTGEAICNDNTDGVYVDASYVEGACVIKDLNSYCIPTDFCGNWDEFIQYYGDIEAWSFHDC